MSWLSQRTVKRSGGRRLATDWSFAQRERKEFPVRRKKKDKKPVRERLATKNVFAGATSGENADHKVTPSGEKKGKSTKEETPANCKSFRKKGGSRINTKRGVVKH